LALPRKALLQNRQYREDKMATEKGKHGEHRGSQKLLERLAKNGETPSPKEIIEAFNFPASAKIPNWLIRGIPPVYLELEGSVEVPIADLSTLVQRIVALNDSAINLKILINGIPIPEIAQVTVANT
jgi:hypothetical protein